MKHKAKIISMQVGETETKGTVFVSVKVELPDQQNMFAKIYITEKSYGIARTALKRCGFDSDKQELSDIEKHPEMFAGNEVEVEVYDDPPYGTKCEIVIDRPKVDAGKLKAASDGLRSVKKAKTEESGIPF